MQRTQDYDPGALEEDAKDFVDALQRYSINLMNQPLRCYVDEDRGMSW